MRTYYYFLKMPIDNNSWRERNGLFNITLWIHSSSNLSHTNSTPFINHILLLSLVLFLFAVSSELLVFFLLFLSGDIELNPGVRNYSNLKICFWNLNSLPSYNFAKLSLLQAYNSLHKFDIICLSETYLDSTISSNDPQLSLAGYKIIRSDNPLNIKKGGVCIFFKETLPLNIVNITQLKECLVVEILYNNRKCFLVTLYRSPSQSLIEFDGFMTNFENLIDSIHSLNPYFIIILGDFNAKLKKWKTDDIDTNEGKRINDVTSSYALSQIISGPTHILPHSSSCIDLIFTNHPNLITNSGIHPSLHPNCHHQIIFAEIDFKVFFPPPYERLIWHYKRAHQEGIKTCINNFNWDRAFLNKSIDNQVNIFNNTILNIMSNFIPNEIITVNDKDPPWISHNIKQKISYKDSLFQKYIKNGKNVFDLRKVELARFDIINAIADSKKKYYERISYKFINPNTAPKTYWSILKSLYYDKKIPVIPPLFHNNSFITNFKEKAEMFTRFFPNQYSLIVNESTLLGHLPEPPNFFS